MNDLIKYLPQSMLMLLVAGCTVGPNYHTPIHKLPSHYSASKPKPQSNQVSPFWWKSIQDPILVQLIDCALNGSNTDIQKVHAKIRQARAELGVAQAIYYPQLNASGRLVRDHLSGNSELISNFPAGSIPLTYTNYKFGFDASWELDFFGHNKRTLQASTARFQSAVEDQYNIALITSAEIANVYTQYRVYQRRIFIAEQTIKAYLKTQRLVELQMDAGSANNVDLQRVKSEVLSSKAALPLLQADARAALASLAVLVGEYPESLIKTLAKNAPIPTISTKNLSVGIPSDLLLRRPDIKIAERNLAAATADVGVAVSNLFPRFQLIGNLGFDTIHAGSYFQAASRYWTLGPQMSMPIFRGGSLKNTVNAQEAVADGVLADYKHTVLQALADVESSLIRYEKERIRRQELVASFNTLKTSLRLVNLQYKEGQTTLLDVLDVERKLHQLADSQAQSTGQVTINLVALYKALGGSWVLVAK